LHLVPQPKQMRLTRSARIILDGATMAFQRPGDRGGQ
jgi:hypothetical protein